LPLFSSAVQVARRTVFLELCDMALHGPPALDLARVIRVAPAHVVAAIPLEPSARIVGVDPALCPPVAQWLGGIDAEEVEVGVMLEWVHPGMRKPLRREFIPAIGHVLATKNSQYKHFHGGQVGFKIRVKVTARRFGEPVGIPLLQVVVDDDLARFHADYGFAVAVACRVAAGVTSAVAVGAGVSVGGSTTGVTAWAGIFGRPSISSCQAVSTS